MSDAREALVALILERFRAAETYMDLPRQAGLLADAILAAGWTPPGERVKPSEDDDSDVHDHRWERRQNVTSRGYRMTPYEVCVVDGCDAARQVRQGGRR